MIKELLAKMLEYGQERLKIHKAEHIIDYEAENVDYWSGYTQAVKEIIKEIDVWEKEE